MGKVIRLFFFVLIVSGLATVAAPVQPADLLKDPTPREWAALSRFDGTLTRAQFEDRLKGVFDPFGGLSPFLRITDSEVVVSSVTNAVTPVATISFAFANQDTPEPKEIDSPLRSPTDSQEEDLEESLPLNGLKVVIDPADIGGSWGPMEDRSSYYRGYGRIQEGDLNLLVSSLLSERLRQLGAEVFVTRETAEPVCVASVPDVAAIVPAVLSGRPHMLTHKEHPQILAHLRADRGGGSLDQKSGSQGQGRKGAQRHAAGHHDRPPIRRLPFERLPETLQNQP